MQRQYFANKGPSSQSYGFSSSHVWMWELDYKESWAPKNDAFELWCWRRLLRVPWTAKRSNWSILKISPGCSLEGLMLKLKLQYFGRLMQRVDLLETTLMLERIGGRRRSGQQRMRWLVKFGWIPGVQGGQGGLVCCDSWCCKESDVNFQNFFHNCYYHSLRQFRDIQTFVKSYLVDINPLIALNAL